MRTRNIKINIFLNEKEKQMLIEKSNKAGLTQSDFIRNIIMYYNENPLSKIDVEKIKTSLSDICNNLSNLSNKLNHLGYYNFEIFLDKQITEIRNVISKMQK